MFSTLSAATLRTAALAVTLVAGTAATALAQSGPPGACDCAIGAPMSGPVTSAPAPVLPKWGIGLHAGGLSLAPEENKDAKTDYSVGGVQLRYRIAPRWQLELASSHATQKLQDGTDGELSLDAVTLAALFHPRPFARWDWYALAGVGGAVDGNKDLTKEERKATEQGVFALGAGVERRWHHIGFAAELRLIGMSPADAPKDQAAPADPMTVPATMPTSPSTDASRRTGGGQFTLGATYYF